jgi:hypothetical protein
MLFKFADATEWNALAAVRCRRLVSHSGPSQSSEGYLRQPRTTVRKTEVQRVIRRVGGPEALAAEIHEPSSEVVIRIRVRLTNALIQLENPS